MEYPHSDIIEIKNPKWVTPDQSAIDLHIKWTHSNDDYWPFTAHSNDGAGYGRALFNAAKNGDYGEITPFDNDAHEAKMIKLKARSKIRALEKEIAPLRDEALAGIISDDDRNILASLVKQSKSLRQVIQ